MKAIKKVVITGDTNSEIPEASLELLKNPDLLIADAIVPPNIHIKKTHELRRGYGTCRAAQCKKIALIHLSHLFRPHHIESLFLPLGYDGQVFEF
nr:hypothetical protein [Methanosarcina barkeri]